MIQFESFANNFDSAMKKITRNGFKKLFLILVPFILLMGSYFIFNNILLLELSCGVLSIGTLLVITKNFIEDIKRFNRGPDSEVIVSEEDEVNQILKNGIGKRKAKDFFTKNYQKVTARVISDDEKKYKRALEIQRMQAQSVPHIIPVDIQTNCPSKEAIMKQIIKEIDTYSFVYTIPPLDIENNDWEAYFDTLYRVFSERGNEDKFYNSMSKICRLTLAKALINQASTIQIEDFITNLYYLQSKYGNDGIGQNEKEISCIQIEIASKIQAQKIVNLDDYKKSYLQQRQKTE